MYYSNYSGDYLASLTDRLLTAAVGGPVWCTFDNTARGAATSNALDVLLRLRAHAAAHCEKCGW
jgi:uncharacterized protein YecE (DUF72 family)